MLKNNKGITLISLIVTIIILTILATVSISLILQEDGVLNKTSETIFLNNMEEFKEYSNIEYGKILKNSKNHNDVKLVDVVNSLQNKGFEFEYVEVLEEAVQGINLDKSNILMSINDTNTLKFDFLNGFAENQYFFKFKDNYYRLIKTENGIDVLTNPADLDNLRENNKFEVISSNEVVTIGSVNNNTITLNTGTQTGNALITVMYGNHEATSNIVVKSIPKEGSIADKENVFPVDKGAIDIIWLDKENNVIQNPNAPKISHNGESLTPCIFNESTNSWDNLTRK